MRKQTPSRQSRRSKLVTAAIAFGCVALQVGRRLDLAVLATVIFLVTVLIVDRQAMRRLMMPKFWGVTIFFALASGLFLGPRDLDLLGLRLSAQGLEAGALMVCRGLFIFGLVSWASRAIDGAALTRVFGRVGLGNLGIAIGAAFGLLPALRDRLRERRSQGRGQQRRAAWLRGVFVEVLEEAMRSSQRLAGDLAGRARLVVVTGPRGAGKSTAVSELARGLRASGLDVGGVTQPVIEQASVRLGYELRDAATGERRAFARRKGEGRGFDFDDDGWAWAAARLEEAQRSRDVVVVDELGLLEAQGGGHMETLQRLSEGSGRARLLVAVVRAGTLEPIVEALGEPALVLEAPLTEEQLSMGLAQIGALAR
jgi:nucleoside-triphosphatase THEP1